MSKSKFFDLHRFDKKISADTVWRSGIRRGWVVLVYHPNDGAKLQQPKAEFLRKCPKGGNKV